MNRSELNQKLDALLSTYDGARMAELSNDILDAFDAQRQRIEALEAALAEVSLKHVGTRYGKPHCWQCGADGESDRLIHATSCPFAALERTER